MRTTGILGIILLLLASLASCSEKSRKYNTERIIMVTIEPQRYFTEAIAGNHFKVVTMVPKGSSPESYDPTPKQLIDLGRSEAYFRIGHIGFETVWIDRMMKNAPHTQLFDLSEGVELITDAGQVHGDHVHEGGIDPHIWNSAINAKVIAWNIFSALRTLDKNNETYYLARYDSLIHRIEDTDSIIRSILPEGGNADRAFMIYHPALSYFARDYGLHQICIEEGGKQPSPAHLKELINTCRSEGVHVIFVQPEFDKRNAEIIAKETNTRIVPINPLSYDWDEEMIAIARSLSHSADSTVTL